MVVGSIRSGTSTVAWILSQHFGIRMGTTLLAPDKANPDGYYEDTDLVRLSKVFGSDFMADKIDLNGWQKGADAFFHKMIGLNKPWGFKAVRVSPIVEYALYRFKDATVIRCKRPKGLVVKSANRVFGHDPGRMGQIYDGWETYLDHLLAQKQHLTINYGLNGRLTDQEIIGMINGTYPH